MKLGTLKNAVATLALGLAAWTTQSAVQAQPLYDRVNVNLPYSVTIGEKTLQPGEYVIQQLPSQGNDRIVLIYSDNGMKFKTSAMAIPALDPNTARDTRLELHQVGNDYYLQKIWIQGKDYGYEFPLPDRVKSREKEISQPVTVAGQYSTTSSTDTTTTTSASTTTNTATDQSTVPPITSSDTTPPPDNTANQTPPPPPPDTVTPQPVPQPEPQPTAQGTADRSMDTDANRSTDSSTDTSSMPHTSAGWLLMLLSGGTLSGAGLALRRKR